MSSLTPEAAGNIADQYKEANLARLALAKQVEDLESTERALKQILINHFLASKTRAVSGNNGYVVSLKTKEQPVAKDWLAIQAFIKENDAWDLMQRRLSDSAIAARWAEGIQVTGVESLDVYSLSVKKL